MYKLKKESSGVAGALISEHDTDEDEKPVESEHTDDAEPSFISSDAAISNLNKTLNLWEELSADKKKLSQVKYPKEKVKKIGKAINRNRNS